MSHRQPTEQPQDLLLRSRWCSLHSARRISLRRQLKVIRRKIEVAGHDRAAQGNNPSEANLVPARAPRCVNPQGPRPTCGRVQKFPVAGATGLRVEGEWARGFYGFSVRLFGVKNPLGEKNRRKNRENLRLESQGWCREDAGRSDRGKREAESGQRPAYALRATAGRPVDSGQ